MILVKVIGKPLEETKVAELRRLAACNYSNPKIAEIIGISTHNVGKYRRKLGLAPYKTPEKIRDDQIIFLKRLGFFLPEIANLMKVSYQTVYKHASELAKEDYLEIQPTGQVFALAAEAWDRKKREETLKKVIAFLNSKGGVCSLYSLQGIVSSETRNRLLREHRETIQVIHIK